MGTSTGRTYCLARRDAPLTERARQVLNRREAAESSFPFAHTNEPAGPFATALALSTAKIRFDDRALFSSLARPVGRIGALFLVAVLVIHCGITPRVAAAAANAGQAQTGNGQTGQTYTGPYFGYPPNPLKPTYSKEEEKALGNVQTAFAKYSSSCAALFKPELIGLKGEVPVPVEVAETLRLKAGEALMDPNSLAGALSEASVLMSQPDSQLTEWQHHIAQELKTPLPDYWNMSLKELSELAKEAMKNYIQHEMKTSNSTNSDAPAHLLHAFLFARQLYAIRLAELWRQPETHQDSRVLDYVQSLLSDGKPGNIASMPQVIPDGGRPVTFVLFTPYGDAVMEMSSLDAPVPSKSGKKSERLQRHSAIRIEVVIATRHGATFEFVRYYVFERVPDEYTAKDGPPFADLALADLRWVMPPSSEDQLTWSAGRASIKKNDTFPFQDEMVLRLTPADPYLSANYFYGGPLGPARPGEPAVSIELLQQLEAKERLSSRPLAAVVAALESAPSGVSIPSADKPAPAVTVMPGHPPSSGPSKPASGIKPMFTTDIRFTIPGTNPIGKDLIDNATENVNKAVQWLIPLIANATGPWVELLNSQPRDVANGIIGIHFSVSPTPLSASPTPQLIMSKATASLSLGIPVEHYQDPGAIFEDVLQLLIWNLPPQQNRVAQDKLVQEIKQSAGKFPYLGDPLPPEVLAKLGVGTASQAKSLDPDTPDTGTSTGIYDGDIQGRVIGSTVKCFNFLFNKGVPYFTRLQNVALHKATESPEAGDAETVRYWQRVAATLGEDIRSINSLLEPLPHQLRVEFYFRPEEQTTTRGKAPRPPKIPKSEPGVRMTIALTKEAYEQGPAVVKDALIEELSNQVGGLPIRRAVDDFFLLFGEDPANKGDYFAVTMQQLHPQPDEALGILSKLWPTRASEQAVGKPPSADSN